MAVSISEMEKFAIGGDSIRFDDGDLGNIIELGDINEDFGFGMLANSNSGGGGGTKIDVTHAANDIGRTIKIDSFVPSSQQYSSSSSSSNLNIDIQPLEPLEPISLGGYDNYKSIDMNVMKEAPAPSAPASASSWFGGQTSSAPSIQLAAGSRGDPEAEKKEKIDYINKLQRLESKGFPVSRKFTAENSLEDIKTEYFRLVDARNLETSLKFQRQMLMGAITGMEWLNGRFDPFDLKLEGWSESVHENVEDFDEIFEELYDKYKDRGKMSPEMRLVMAIGGSGFMCHVSNSFFRSKMPSMDDVLRRNPELAKQMAAAAAQQAGPGFGNFMGMAMGVQPPGGMPTSGFPDNGGAPPRTPAPSQQAPMTQSGAFYSASGAPSYGPPSGMTPQPIAAQQQKSTARREMSGPSGVDDILKTFEEVRRAEMTAENIMQPASGYATQPAVSAVMSGAASIHSVDDAFSQVESVRTGATGAGRRKKRTQAPVVGNTFSLNV
jgi:hypothetical protein